MKTLSRIIFISMVIAAITIIPSCKKAGENGSGTAEFSMNMPDGILQLKSGTTDSLKVSYQLLISAVDGNGKEIFTDKLIPLYLFGTGMVSEKIKIPVGEFKLTKFMVIDPAGKVIYAAPVSGSALAYLSTKPLPIKFTITTNNNTNIAVEVLVVGTSTPDQFGYSTFGVQIIKPLDFYAYCFIGPENPLSAAPIVMTEAKVTVSNNNGWSYTFSLSGNVNHLVIRGGSEKYTFTVEKSGYTTQKLVFTSAQLVAATKEHPLAIRIASVSTAPQTMSFQPGPDLGKDAMVSNIDADKNFGTYPYFEASYMTAEPNLTVMRSRRSLIWFDLSALPKSAVISKAVLRLCYDTPIPWDSTIFTGSNLTGFIKPYGVLQQIIEPWEESKVTWNNQPKTTEINQIFIYPFVKNSNVVELDVTKLIVIPAANALPNNGMLFKLSANDKFKGFRFVSSDFTDAGMRPKLNITYTIN
jgi:hypothetical protein